MAEVEPRLGYLDLLQQRALVGKLEQAVVAANAQLIAATNTKQATLAELERLGAQVRVAEAAVIGARQQCDIIATQVNLWVAQCEAGLRAMYAG